LHRPEAGVSRWNPVKKLVGRHGRPKKECDMLTTASQSSDTKNWKDIYVRALLEGDKDRVASLIAEAERAIVERARELFQASGDNIEEEEALDDALYALHALKSCLATHGRFAEAA
jgi:hypothetical protein